MALRNQASSFTGPVAPQSPEDALMEFLNQGQAPRSEPNPSTDPALELAALRGGRQDELQDRVIKDRAIGDSRDAALAGGFLGDVNNDIAADPNTGAAAHAQVASNAAELNKASLANQSPMIDRQHHDEQFALDKLTAPVKERNAGDLAVENLRANAMRDVAQTRGDAMQGVADTKAGQGPKLSVNETDLMDKVNGLKIIAPKALQMMEQTHPGINDPKVNDAKYKSWTDTLGAKFGGMIYRHGGPQDVSDANITQATGYLEAVLPRLLANGRLNLQQYNDLKMHVPQVGFSVGENYQRLQYVMQQILPSIEQGIQTTHGNPPPAAPTYDANDPATWDRVR
jgi:hypothetical protein